MANRNPDWLPGTSDKQSALNDILPEGMAQLEYV
jgi:hypothetical protein